MPANDNKQPAWLTIEAVLLIVLGVMAIVFPLFAGIAVAISVGWLLVIVGVLGLISAFASRRHAHFGWSIASAIIAILFGLLLLLHPLFATIAVTLLIGAYLLFDGVSLIGLALDQKKRGVLCWRWIMGARPWVCGVDRLNRGHRFDHRRSRPPGSASVGRSDTDLRFDRSLALSFLRTER